MATHALAALHRGGQVAIHDITPSAISSTPVIHDPSTLATTLLPSLSSTEWVTSTQAAQGLPSHVAVSRLKDQSEARLNPYQSVLHRLYAASNRWIKSWHASYADWRQEAWNMDPDTEADAQDTVDRIFSEANSWTNGRLKPESLLGDALTDGNIPSYVFEFAPYVHLFSGEQFWPCDIADHLAHTNPTLNYTPIHEMEDDRTLDNLSELNRYGHRIYLTSQDDVESRPDWLGGSSNIPEQRETDGKGKVSPGGKSSAPAVLVVVPKEDGIVDAFWFFFYSYNLGNKVLNVRFGNHVGDWEHTLVRFRKGKPDLVFMSEHNFGEAYAYSALEKIGKRPVVYSAEGSHAMYSTPGLHPYVLPLGLLYDQTDRGPLWDPSMNVHAYTYNYATDHLTASTRTPSAPTDWFYYLGRWGDLAYPMSDRRQYRFAGQSHYVTGPLGARFKRLGRKSVCQGGGPCKIRYWLPPGGEVKEWPGGNAEHEGGEEDR